MEWIEVGRVLPQHNRYVLIHYIDTDGTSQVEEGIYRQNKWEDVTGEPQTVTHWMPLPSPPKH